MDTLISCLLIEGDACLIDSNQSVLCVENRCVSWIKKERFVNFLVIHPQYSQYLESAE